MATTLKRVYEKMDRKQLIQKVEGLRESRVITYLTSDRQGPFNARIAMDVIPFMNKQLQAIAKIKNIDLFLYSSGGTRWSRGDLFP
jgi:hypothetical protein